MNQILSVEMSKDKPKKSNIKSIIIFFSIVLIIFAIIIAIVGVFLLEKKQKEQPQNTVITGTQPNINVEIQSDSKLNIIVTHDKEISNVSYNWNDEDPVEQINIGQSNYELEVDIPSGTNTLNISVTDINGVTQTYSNEYSGSNIMLEQVEDKIKITVQDEKTIAYLSYSWDDDQNKQLTINNTKAEQLIDAVEGEHTLKIIVEYADGTKTTKTQLIKGDLKPEIKVTTDRINFIINASDDEGLTKMTMNLNGNDLDEIIINNEKNYTTSVPLQDGENKLIVTVYNVNDVSNVQRIRWIK